MKERPILFSAPMVRAILEGRKTQTRRVVKPAFGKKFPIQNLKEHGQDGYFDYSGKFNDPLSWGYPYAEDGADMALGAWPELCPYGIGKNQTNFDHYCHHIWVRETWGISNGPGIITSKDNPHLLKGSAGHHVFYKADYSEKTAWGMYGPPKWKPSIHMPRTASRILLEIINVRVERLQDISEADCLAEGIIWHDNKSIAPDRFAIDEKSCTFETAKKCYANLWKEINGATSWDANPWVWVIEFKRVMP